MLVTTLLHAIYISRMPFYETRFARRVELFNEILLMMTCCHFFIFVDPTVRRKEKDLVGTSAIAFISFLLGVNALIILVLAFTSWKRNRYLKKMKKEN